MWVPPFAGWLQFGEQVNGVNGPGHTVPSGVRLYGPVTVSGSRWIPAFASLRASYHRSTHSYACPSTTATERGCPPHEWPEISRRRAVPAGTVHGPSTDGAYT